MQRGVIPALSCEGKEMTERKTGWETIKEVWYVVEAVLLYAMFVAEVVYGLLMWFKVI